MYALSPKEGHHNLKLACLVAQQGAPFGDPLPSPTLPKQVKWAVLVGQEVGSESSGELAL